MVCETENLNCNFTVLDRISSLIVHMLNEDAGKKLVNYLKFRPLFLTFIGSTKTSTIKGISIAGSTPNMTLYTPALDVEYMEVGEPTTLKEIPITPEGIPTPALLTRALIHAMDLPRLIVDAGSYVEPKVPHIILPSRRVGEVISSCKALPEGVPENLFNESRAIAESIDGLAGAYVVGESMPGGTTTALGILIALGYEAYGLVSSAGPNNPHRLKRRIIEACLRSKVCDIPTKDVFKAVSCLGDPLHISIAGFVYEALRRNHPVLLAGGTQMASVLAIIKEVDKDLLAKNVGIGTTRWIIEDKSSDIVRLVKMIAPEVPVIVYNYNFSEAPYEGLKYYERGYVKEGVGAGGIGITASAIGLTDWEIYDAIIKEYERVRGLLRV